MIPLSIMQGAISLWGPLNTRATLKERVIAEALAKHLGFDIETPWKDLTPEQQHAVFSTARATIYLRLRPPVPVDAADESNAANIVPVFTGSFQLKNRSITLKMTMRRMKTPSPDYFVKMSCRTCEGTRLNPWVKAP